jgi:hypothetical protein
MHDNDVLDMFRTPHAKSVAVSPSKMLDDAEPAGEGECRAFGFLRGLHDRSQMLELRLRDRNSAAYPYHCLASVRFNPSVGLLLKYTGDVVTLVLIRGSNLDVMVSQGNVCLTLGIFRHRLVWIKEMTEDELRQAKDGEPTIDRIEMVESDSQDVLLAWLKQKAPVFARDSAAS